jgi:hypothetical protein
VIAATVSLFTVKNIYNKYMYIKNIDRQDAVGPRTFHQMQLDQHSGEAESDDPRIKAHANPAKRFRFQPSR